MLFKRIGTGTYVHYLKQILQALSIGSYLGSHIAQIPGIVTDFTT